MENYNVESFSLDHTKVKAPYVRLCKTVTTEHGDIISKFDIRFKQPNNKANDYFDPSAAHTLEHLLAVELNKPSCPIKSIDISLGMCLTMAYWVVLGTPSEEDVEAVLVTAIDNILSSYHVNDPVPGATVEGCGRADFHNMPQALVELNLFLQNLGDGYYK